MRWLRFRRRRRNIITIIIMLRSRFRRRDIIMLRNLLRNLLQNRCATTFQSLLRNLLPSLPPNIILLTTADITELRQVIAAELTVALHTKEFHHQNR